MKQFLIWLTGRSLTFWNWAKRNALEILLFAIAIGNAEVLHQYLTSTGSKESWQLVIAIYATEILVVWSSAWGITGLMLATVLFVVSLISIYSVFKQDALGHAYFSIAIYCGAIGNFFRKYDWRALPEPVKMVKGVYSNDELLSLTVIEIREAFKLTFSAAKAIRNRAEANLEVTKDFINELR